MTTTDRVVIRTSLGETYAVDKGELFEELWKRPAPTGSGKPDFYLLKGRHGTVEINENFVVSVRHFNPCAT